MPQRKKPSRGKKAAFKEVYKAWGSAEAEVVKSFLRSHSISCLLRGQVVQSVHPFSMDGLGEIRILVPEEDFALAKKLLESRKDT
ncbi:MAG: DUF2007 domain-containing protein [Candidatus Aminicenantales bacterium]